MKKMMLIAVVFMMAQVSMAAGLTREAALDRVKPYAERVEKAKLDKAGDFTKDAKVNNLIESSLIKITREAGAGNTKNLIRLINNDSSAKVLATVARLSSVIKESKLESEKAVARKALDLLSLAGNNMEMLTKNDAEKDARSKQIELAIDVCENIAKFSQLTSETAIKYAAAYEKGLEESMTVSKAIEKASAIKKLSEEDLKKECIL